LHSLPVEESQKSIWHAVLNVSDFNGDFQRKRPANRSTKVDAECLSGGLPGISEVLRNALAKKHGRAGRRLTDALVTEEPYAGRRWAFVRFMLDDETFLVIGLRQAESSQPQVQIKWSHVFPIKLRAEYRRLDREPNFQRIGESWTWIGTVSPAAWRTDRVKALANELATPINALVHSGVMRVDAANH
jgi:hypothetical protein